MPETKVRLNSFLSFWTPRAERPRDPLFKTLFFSDFGLQFPNDLVHGQHYRKPNAGTLSLSLSLFLSLYLSFFGGKFFHLRLFFAYS